MTTYLICYSTLSEGELGELAKSYRIIQLPGSGDERRMFTAVAYAAEAKLAVIEAQQKATGDLKQAGYRIVAGSSECKAARRKYSPAHGKEMWYSEFKVQGEK